MPGDASNGLKGVSPPATGTASGRRRGRRAAERPAFAELPTHQSSSGDGTTTRGGGEGLRGGFGLLVASVAEHCESTLTQAGGPGKGVGR